MSNSKFNNVKIKGITTVVPNNRINIEDEISFYNDDLKTLERNKKILGLGTRYVVEKGVTALDLCEEAARNLINEMDINKDEIDAVVFVSACHDYHAPASACILHGRLDLNENCACFDVGGLSCSGFVYGLWLAHSLISSGASKKCLLLAGDTNSMHSNINNRNSIMLYGDAGSATLLEYTEEANTAYFHMGTRGKDWDKIIAPSIGHRLPIKEDILNLEIKDKNGNVWHFWEDILQGMDVFKFTLDKAPSGIQNVIEYSGIAKDDIDFYAMHQANGQIVKTVAQHSGIPKDKFSAETFTKYANCGSAAIVTNICDQLKNKNIQNLLLATFGIGFSWGMAIVNLENTYIGDIKHFIIPENFPSREEQINHWIKYVKGEL